MKVHELRTILDHVPDDLPIIISGGRGAIHVTEVRRYPTQRNAFPGFQVSDMPAHLRIGRDARTVPWHAPEPDFTLAGPFRRAEELLAKLDPEVPR